MMISSELKLGIAGIGNMGLAHARSIWEGKVERVRLAAVADGNPARLEMVGKSQQGIALFADAEEMIHSGKIDAILVATPHYSHTTIGIAALQAGLHVLVEKPISVHKEDCEKLIAAHRDEKQVFAAMFNQRTDLRYRKLKQMIDTGELGRVNRINWIITDWFRTECYYASGGWRATWAGEGGGVLLNQCPHQLDLMQWLFGMPVRVRGFCQIGRFHDIEVEDDVTAYLEYASGATGVFITTTGEAPGTNRLEVAAERGRVVIEGDTFEFIRNEQESAGYSKTSDEPFGKPSVWNVSIPVTGKGDQHTGILKNFVAACLDGAELLAPAREGVHSVELGNAILYSSETGETVHLPLDSARYAALLKKKIASSTFKKKPTKAPEKPADMSGSF